MNFWFYIFIVLVCYRFDVSAQIQRIAITDFDNTSGIVKYNGLGKALGSMLISDIESNVSPKRIQLIERSQINRILGEQNFQKTPNVDVKTAVDFGKILGVKFLLVGDVFVLNESIVINARLVDTENAIIYFTEKIEGNLTEWLALKTNLAKAISLKLNLPFQNPTMTDVEMKPASIITYSQAIIESDKGNYERAVQIIETLREFEPNLIYLNDLENEIEKLKSRVTKLEMEVKGNVENPIEVATNYSKNGDYLKGLEYLKIGRGRLESNELGGLYEYYKLLAQFSLSAGNVENSFKYCDSLFSMYPYDDEITLLKSNLFVKRNQISDAIHLLESRVENYQESRSASLFSKSLKNWATSQDIYNKINWGNIGIRIIDNRDNFIIQSEHFEFRQGTFFSILFSTLLAFKEKSTSADKIVEYLENLELQDKNKQNETDYEIVKAYYLPRTKFLSGNSSGGEWSIAKSGANYIGDYHEVSDGKTWTKKDPMSCPCELLFKKEVYEKLKVKSNRIITDDQMNKEFSLGWYYLQTKNYTKAILTYGSVAKYLDEKQGYEKQTKWFNDFRAMTTINTAHGYLLKGSEDDAARIYNSVNRNYIFGEEWGKNSLSQVLDIDWSNFINQGLISQATIKSFRTKLK